MSRVNASRLDPARFSRELTRRGLTQQQLSQISGVNQATISRAATGRAVHPATLKRLLVALMTVPTVPGAELIA